MKISILCTNKNHPVNTYIKKWIENNQNIHKIDFFCKKNDLQGGDILFLISCHEIVNEKDRGKFTKTLIMHASDLPKGRGWSPHIWEIINGSSSIVITLFEAKNKVDTGDIWKKIKLKIDSCLLYDEINNLVFDAEMKLMSYAVDNFRDISPEKQVSITDNIQYRLRNKDDSRLDPDKTIREQFNLIRVCDSERFPAFFDLNDCRFQLKIEKISNHDK